MKPVQIFALLAVLVFSAGAAHAYPKHGHGHQGPGHHGPGWGYPGHGPGYPGPGYPGPGPGYPPPGYGYPPPGYNYGYGVTCFAQNNFGTVFYFTSGNVYQSQQGAMQVCYNYGSAWCQPAGCR